MSNNVNIKVDGIAMYPAVHRPNPHSGCYSVDLVVDDKAAEALEQAGLQQARDREGNVKSYADVGIKGKVFRFKRKTQTRSGETMTAPRVVDSQGNPIPASIIIGNGSKVRVYGSAYEYKTPGGKSGVAGGLNDLQVIELVEFSRVDTIEGGFTVGNVVESEELPTQQTPLNPDDNPF